MAAVAELDLLGADGNSLSHDGWTVLYVDSEERQQIDGSAENVIDGQTVKFLAHGIEKQSGSRPPARADFESW